MKSVINAAIQEANRQKRVISLNENPSRKRLGSNWERSQMADRPNRYPEDLVETEDLHQAILNALFIYSKRPLLMTITITKWGA